MAPKAKKSAPPAVNPEVAEFMEKLRTEMLDSVMEMKETFEQLAIQYKSDALERIEEDIPQDILEMKFVDLCKKAESDKKTVEQDSPSLPICRDEVAISISGSPVVLEENADPQIQAISKLLAGDGKDLSPESSKLANAVENLLKDKFKL